MCFITVAKKDKLYYDNLFSYFVHSKRSFFYNQIDSISNIIYFKNYKML